MRLTNIKYLQKTGLFLFLFLGLQLALTYSVYAQSTELKIIDLSVESKSVYTITNENEEINMNDTLIVGFKMNKADLAKKVIVHIGNKEGRKNIVNAEYTVIHDGSLYYVNMGSKRFQIKYYNTYFEIPIKKSDSEGLLYFTIYVEDSSGQRTSELTYKL